MPPRSPGTGRSTAHCGGFDMDRDQLEQLLGDMESYLQHKPTCARLLTKKDCDCGLVELMTRVHAELEDDEDE